MGVRVDGEALGRNRYIIGADDTLTIPDLPDEMHRWRSTSGTRRNAIPSFSGLYVSGGNFFTQCEAEGFRRITYFPDRPDVMARFTTTVVAERAKVPVLLSNGNPAASGQDGDKHWATWIDPHPKPAYLFAVVAGDLVAVRDHFTTRSGRHVDLAIWVRRGGRGSLRPRHAGTDQVDEMGRGYLRPGIRSRRLQHRRGLRLQHGRDGEQGPQRLQHHWATSWPSRTPRRTSTTKTSRR